MSSSEDTPITVRRASAQELAQANALYRSINFVPSGEGDLLAVAHVGEELAGLGRLVPVTSDSAELGGIYVLEAFRHRGIARKIVEFLIAASAGRGLYCIPFAHLEQFYRSFGFEPVDAGSRLPEAVADKVGWCHATYPSPVRVLWRGHGGASASGTSAG